ncbi:archaetidylserine decarboxylase [Marinobacteraceae bacterium S3BR75-40.1]
MYDKLFVLSQHLTPQHTLSRTVGRLAQSRSPAIKNTFINWFIQRFGVDMSEAVMENGEDYETFNDFFTRALKPGARLIEGDEKTLNCPVDGYISQLGAVSDERVFQAKGHSFTLTELLGDRDDLADPLRDGQFATLYLSPSDYHRIHMPITGRLREMVYIPGRLFSVNPVTAENVPRLFARNERVAVIFDTDWGPMAMVLVGAMIVASVETVWSGLIQPHGHQIKHTSYVSEPPVELERGTEMGRFRLGSTVVMVLPKGSCEFEASLESQQAIRMGQVFGRMQ